MSVTGVLLAALSTLPQLVAGANGSHVIFQSPTNARNGQGVLEFPLHKDIDLRWDSTLSLLNCDVYQGPNEDGEIAQQQVFSRPVLAAEPDLRPCLDLLL